MRKLHIPTLSMGIVLLSVVVMAGCGMPNLSVTPSVNNIRYGSEERQYLDLYLPDNSSGAVPVFLWSHANGGSVESIDAAVINPLHELNVAVISWGSIRTLSTAADVETAWADAELMLQWVRDNASQYNFNTERIFTSGRSRGTGASWKITHAGGIVGYYMYNALPDPFWEYGSAFEPDADVNANSPTGFLVYGPAPGVEGDIHDPDRGLLVAAAYERLGIANRITVMHSINNISNATPWSFLQSFVRNTLEALDEQES